MTKIAGIEFAEQQVRATRFAPSPNGRLHLGHAYSALCAHDFARRFGGQFYLRIEDIDGTRSRPEHVDAIMRDVEWLGLSWDGAVHHQSSRIAAYADALHRLRQMGLLFRCVCTRAEIIRALKLCTVPHGPDGPQYPGTCKGRQIDSGQPHCWRIDMMRATSMAGALFWNDLAAGAQSAEASLFGDVVLWRKDAPASYHLAATLDDSDSSISHVVRGQDLFAYTSVHRLLQTLLGLPEPVYWHHPLLLDANGEKLAKSRFSQPLAELRAAGMDGAELIASLRAGELPLGITRSSA